MFKKLLNLVGLLALGACAIISSPTGGEKDETPPEIIHTNPPNQSINFSSKSIEIWFDEYIELKDFNTQFYSSPPLEKSLQPKLKGKRLTLYIDEDLLPNTTYTFSFGTCLHDITEGNIQTEFKYVFSTGSYLDSLSISGQVVDAYTGLPLEGIITSLYPTNVHDSILLQHRPLYYSITNAQGLFSIDNLAEQDFQLLAVKDENLNLRYDEGAEQYGFISQQVSSSSQTPLTIRAFLDPQEHNLKGAKYTGFGKAILGFGQPTKQLEVTVVENVEMPASATPTFIEFERDRDTAYFWFDRNAYPENLRFMYINVAFDGMQEDSVRLSLTKARQQQLTLASAEPSAIAPTDSLILESNLPIVNLNTELITVVKDQDTLTGFKLTQNALRTVHVDVEKTYGNTFIVHLLPNALTTMYGPNEDTIAVSAKVAREEDLAILLLKLSSADQDQKIYQLFEIESRKIISEQTFTNQVDLTLANLLPQKYGLRIIWDTNKNGKWDVGEFATRKQPEDIRYYPNNIELRANWELELDWRIPALDE